MYWFCHISTCIRHRYTCAPYPALLPPPSQYHPCGSSHCTSPKYLVSCIKSGLATHFIHDIIHISMSFSQISPPSPSPTESLRLIYTSVSLFLSRIQGYCYHSYWHFKKYIYICQIHDNCHELTVSWHVMHYNAL